MPLPGAFAHRRCRRNRSCLLAGPRAPYRRISTGWNYLQRHGLTARSCLFLRPVAATLQRALELPDEPRLIVILSHPIAYQRTPIVIGRTSVVVPLADPCMRRNSAYSSTPLGTLRVTPPPKL